MGKNSKIDWTDHTWNCWQGCKKVSAGCQNCYMFRDKKRYGQDPDKVIRSKPATFYKPMTWKDTAMVFVCSWSDFFIEEADAWRYMAWDIIRNSPQLIFQILTKRPERIMDHLPSDWGEGYPNVWLGVTLDFADSAFYRMSKLFQAKARIKFTSFEPMITGHIGFNWNVWGYHVDWIIAGRLTGYGHKHDPRLKDLKKIVTGCADTQTRIFLKDNLKEIWGEELIQEFPE